MGDINYELLNDFHQTISTKFFAALAAAPVAQYLSIATEIPSASARNTYPFLGTIDDMREWLGPRIAKQLKSHRYAIENREFELTIEVPKNELKDDAGGAVAMYSGIAALHAASVALQPDQLMFREIVAMDPPDGQAANALSYDGQNFYDTDHPMGSTTASNDMGGSGTAWYLLDTSKPLKPFIFQNREDPQFVQRFNPEDPKVFNEKLFTWGASRRNSGGYGLWQSAIRSKQTLNYDNLKAAFERFATFKNDEGRPMGMRGTLLVVPETLRWTAREILEFPNLLAGAGAPNPAFGMVPHIVNAWL